MRFPLIYIPKTRFRKYFRIEKQYRSERLIVPIGYDCNPAYTLQKLNIRKFSLPFDWLNTQPLLGIRYVTENMKSGFDSFYRDIDHDEFGYYVAKKYPYAEFMHEKRWDDKTAEKYRRRAARYMQLTASKEISFLYNLMSEALKTETDVIDFQKSVIEFLGVIKPNDSLHLYIRYDETYEENQILNDLLYSKLEGVANLCIARFIRHKKKFGNWGNPKEYPQLYQNLSLKIYPTFPRIYVR
jgi:hypothetical protein